MIQNGLQSDYSFIAAAPYCIRSWKPRQRWGISRTQEDGTSVASEAELSTEDALDNDLEYSEYGSDTSNSECGVSDTEVSPVNRKLPVMKAVRYHKIEVLSNEIGLQRKILLQKCLRYFWRPFMNLLKRPL